MSSQVCDLCLWVLLLYVCFLGTFKFTYDGQRIQRDQTPAEVMKLYLVGWAVCHIHIYLRRLGWRTVTVLMLTYHRYVLILYDARVLC
jgi:hypothetical protein